MSKQFQIRSANDTENHILTELAIHSKAYWDYDAKFLEACKPALTITPEQIQNELFFVLTVKEDILGFYGLEKIESGVDLTYFFVSPDYIGQGFGRILFHHAISTARRLGHVRLVIESDPNAAPFYERMGAVKKGYVPSTVQKGRELPLYHYSLA